MRIQSIVNELGGEKIDVVAWNADDKAFIANSLSPAKVNYVVLDPNSSPRTATVVVPDDQLSLAIGKEGQNARLAAKLTGWRIDIKNQTIAIQEDIKPGDRVATIATDGRDILAMAEAILLGKTPPEKAEIEPAQIEIEPEAEPIEAQAEETPAQAEGVSAQAEIETVQIEAEPVTAQIGAEPTDQETVPATAAAPEVVESVQEGPTPEPEGTSVEEPTVVETMAVPAPEKQKEPEGVEPQAPPRRPRRRYEYVADETLETEGTSKKKARRKRRRLVRDEESGELVVERRHKREQDDELNWEDFLERG
jgi:N utilization substance protein A